MVLIEFGLGLLNKLPGGSGKPYVPPKENVEENHPLTIEDYIDYNNKMVAGAALGRLISNTHQHFVEQRRHEELLDEIRRGRM